MPSRCTISQIYLIKYTTCFGHVYCTSSGVSPQCIHTIGICHASSVDPCVNIKSSAVTSLKIKVRNFTCLCSSHTLTDPSRFHWIFFLGPAVMYLPSHLNFTSWYYQNLIYSPTDALVKYKVHSVEALRLCTGCTVHRGSRGIGKGKVHRCTGTEALYRPYGP